MVNVPLPAVVRIKIFFIVENARRSPVKCYTIFPLTWCTEIILLVQELNSARYGRNEKCDGGVEAQAAHLREEGHTIEPGRGKKLPQIQDFEGTLVEG